MFERIDSCPDPLAEIWQVVRGGSVMAARIEARAPWCLQFGSGERRVGFHVVIEGTLRLVTETEQLFELNGGEVVLLPHGTPHLIADQPDGLAPSDTTQVRHLAPGERFDIQGGVGRHASLLCGSYAFAATGANPLLRGLPEVVRATFAADTSLGRTVALLAAEAAEPQPGASLMIERLVDLLFLQTLRAWSAQSPERTASTLIGALGDPQINPAIRAFHAEPARNWSLDGLASLCGLSRAVFVRRFRRAVGESPGAYVTRWRMAQASQRLASGERIAAVAAQVGYANEFAFAKAFKRFSGNTPGRHRQLYVARLRTGKPSREDTLL
jgi:AraC-like DNA-binding protein